MQIYPLDSNGVWNGVVQDARPDPMVKGEFLIPANCATITPPVTGQNQVAQFTNGAWQVVPDFRGLKYWLADRSLHSIVDAGVSPPDGHLTEDPGPTPAQLWTAYQQAAQVQLAENDRVAIRCAKAGVTYPPAWLATDQALRLIVAAPNGVAGTLPTKPPYPAGT